MECVKCKKSIPEDSKFCEYCGEKVEKEEIKVETPPKILSDIMNHLEFMGYEVGETQTEDTGLIRLLATNKNRSNLFITYFPSVDMLTFAAVYTIKQITDEVNKHKFLEAINQLNGTTIVSVLYANPDFNSISGSAWYPGTYSRKEFSNFLDFFEGEINRVLRSDILKEFIFE